MEAYPLVDLLAVIDLDNNYMLNLQLMSEIKKHALVDKPNEACGLILKNNNNYSYFPCRNIAYVKTGMAILDPLDYIRANSEGEIIAHAHSQPEDGPSLVDSYNAYNHNIYSIIYTWENNKFYIIEPRLMDYLDKDFKIGKYDCLELVKNYYKQELGIEINHYNRAENWFESNPKIIYENFGKEGFREIDNLKNVKKHDILLFGNEKTRIYHVGIYLDNDLIIHHPRNSKSCIEYLNHHYKKDIILITRHKNYE